MRLNRRERFLVTVLMLLLLWTGFYKLWAEPQVSLIFWEWEQARDLEMRIKSKGTENKNDSGKLRERLENAGKGQIYFTDLSPEQMDMQLQNLAEISGIQLLGMKIGETSPMETDGYVYTALSLEFLCISREQAAAFVDHIKNEGGAVWISSLELEQEEAGLKGVMEVSYCHEQKE